MPTGVADVFEDARGRLTLLPLDEAPFAVARAYVLSDIPPGERRAGHACRTQQRLLVCASGASRVTLDDGRDVDTFELRAGATLHIPAGVWHEVEASREAPVIVVLADGPYDPADYVSDRAQLPLAAATASQTASA